MKSRNLIIVLFLSLAILIAVYFFSSLNKTEDEGLLTKNGIKGIVVASPICPVQKEGDDSCNDKPVEANIIVKNKKKNTMKTLETLDDGSFSVNLSPGNYVIYTDPDGNGIRQSKPEYIKVEEGKFADVTVRIDTGIR